MTIAGSPPHTREESLQFCLQSVLSRITPAYAGRISPTHEEITDVEDHPRIRGKNFLKLRM